MRAPLTFLVLALMLHAASVSAQSHANIDRNRSSISNNLFLFQAVEGEFGKFTKTYKDSPVEVEQTWKGYGIRNGFGLELFKFTQFSLSHTLLNLRSRESSLENMRGSNLAGELAFSFSAPIANIQFGIGAVASQMDYQNETKVASFVGSGHYYDMGINYFLSPMFSLQVIGKRTVMHHAASSGTLDVQEINSNMNSLSLGFGIWIP